MDEQRYLHLADDAFKAIERAFEAVDPDLAEATLAGDVLTIAYRDGSRCIVNTQRPTRQIWLAARSRGWHFDYDEKNDRWVDDRGAGVELMSLVAQVTRETVGVELPL
ncbi:MAG: iron donor protein CyaY [Micrococcales bacterium]|nr:iron donor protein CyaY [Micrococcales bacterium]